MHEERFQPPFVGLYLEMPFTSHPPAPGVISEALPRLVGSELGETWNSVLVLLPFLVNFGPSYFVY